MTPGPVDPDDPPVVVLIADQRRSRVVGDRVPGALATLNRLPGLVLGFERTAGDEIQGLTASPATVVGAVLALSRTDEWRIGLGLGTVERPLPASTRAARGGAYLAARTAIEDAHKTTSGLLLRAAGNVGPPAYDERAVRDAESALWLLRALLARRTRQGWEVTDLVGSGLTNKAAAQRLGISPSAVSQRLARAANDEVNRGIELAQRLLGDLIGRPGPGGGR